MIYIKKYSLPVKAYWEKDGKSREIIFASEPDDVVYMLYAAISHEIQKKKLFSENAIVFSLEWDNDFEAFHGVVTIPHLGKPTKQQQEILHNFMIETGLELKNIYVPVCGCHDTSETVRVAFGKV